MNVNPLDIVYDVIEDLGSTWVEMDYIREMADLPEGWLEEAIDAWIALGVLRMHPRGDKVGFVEGLKI